MARTTHDPLGGGLPRLLFAVGGQAPATIDGQAPPTIEQRKFDLVPGVTVIGSGADADLRLAGLDERHAEVRRDAADEYVYVDLGSVAGSRVDGQPVGERMLHTGDRIELGGWTLCYYRDEYADHGRPFGGRQGGDPTPAPLQPEPRPRGTSPQGGSHPQGTDPGEYF